MRKLVIATVTVLSLCSAFAQSQNTGAQTLNQEMSGLAGKLNKALVAQRFTNVAAVDRHDPHDLRSGWWRDGFGIAAKFLPDRQRDRGWRYDIRHQEVLFAPKPDI